MEEEQDQQIRFSRNHVWIRLEEEIGTLGLTNYAQAELGEIISVELCEIGEKIERGEAMGEIESVKTAIEIISPVTATVVGVNTDLHDHPALVNEGAYTEGWLIEVRLKNSSEVESLMDFDEYYDFVNREENPI